MLRFDAMSANGMLQKVSRKRETLGRMLVKGPLAPFLTRCYKTSLQETSC